MPVKKDRAARARDAGRKAAMRVQGEFAIRLDKGEASVAELVDSTRYANKVHDQAYSAAMKGTARSLSDFKPGDVVVLTEKSRHGEEKRAALISAVDYMGRGYVLYSGWTWPDTQPSGQGSFYPDLVGGSPFGLQKVEVVGHHREPVFRGPRPGDRGYDLMC